MNSLIISLNARLNQTSVPMLDRPRFLACALAIILSRRASLPETPVDSPKNFFLINELEEIQRAISVVNEHCVVDISVAKTVSETLWLVRYKACHPEAFSSVDKTYGFFDSYVGVGSVVTESMHGFLNEYKKQFDLVLPVLASIIDR